MSVVKTFWTSDEKIPISQTKVAIPSDNNLSYSAGQKIVISVPPTIEYFNPVNSYLEFDALINLPSGRAPTRLQLDKHLGGGVLVKDIRIVSQQGGGGVVLEELQDINVLATLKADYHVNDNERQKRALTSGATIHSIYTESDQGSEITQGNNHRTNPFYSTPEGAAGVTFLGEDSTDNYFGLKDENKPHKARLQVKLESGIFQNRKIFPCKMLGGLHIEIILEDNNKIYRQLDNVRRCSYQNQNPIFGGAKSADDPEYNAGIPVHDGTGNDANGVDYILLTPSNGMWGNTGQTDHGALNCPFALGEAIGIKNFRDALTNNDVILVDNTNAVTDPRIKSIKSTDVGVILHLAKKVLVKNGGTAVKGIGEGTTVIGDTNFVYSKSVTADADYEPTITISDVNLILERVEMPAGYTAKMLQMMKEGGQLTYDFISYTNYKHSQLANDRVANIRLNLMNQKGKSIICIPTDASVYTTQQAIAGCVQSATDDASFGTPSNFTYHYSGTQNTGTAANPAYGSAKSDNPVAFPTDENWSERSGLVGISDNITEYQFYYDGKLNPNRPVKCSKTSSLLSIDQQLCVEQEKALASAGMPALSFYNFQKNFFIGRSFALGDNSADLRNIDFNIQVNYRETLAPEKPKMWNCYVAHIRRIVVRGEDVMVEV
jgi:hypothetical protein